VIAFSAMLADWLGRHAYSATDAAKALGCPVVTFRGWVAGRSEPDYFTKCAIVRQMRDGHDPLSDVRMSPVEFTNALKCWRAKHGFTQREAAAAIGTSAETIRGWESQAGVPRQPALGEILRRLRMPVDVELVKQATKRPRPIDPEKFAELMRAWRRRCKLSRSQAAYALRSTGLATTARTIWMWESAKALPQRPFAVLELIHGPLAVNPPKPKPLIAPKQFAKALRDWRRKHCLTQAQACVALGLPRDQALISDWESGKAFPRKPRLEQLVAALKQPPATGPGTHNWFKARSHEFGQKLRAWRKARGLRQLDACAVLALPRDQGLICRYERGEASPRRERMTRILAIIAGTEVQP
jgi:transcriptional regulator with XRE-family HTH domain